jgi:SAM-dependent methyltransferase
MSHGGIVRTTLAGTERLRGGTGISGALLVARRKEIVLAPDATVAKFDQNACGWDGKPGTPGYAHFRWMRRFVGTFAPEDWMRASAERILDFGCGAGWVGIEAALLAGASRVELCAFDPSPEMVRIAGRTRARAGSRASRRGPASARTRPSPPKASARSIS